jgi:hypothetical protein
MAVAVKKNLQIALFKIASLSKVVPKSKGRDHLIATQKAMKM